MWLAVNITLSKFCGLAQGPQTHLVPVYIVTHKYSIRLHFDFCEVGSLLRGLWTCFATFAGGTEFVVTLHCASGVLVERRVGVTDITEKRTLSDRGACIVTSILSLFSSI